MSNHQSENQLLTVAEVSNILHIHRNTVHHWVDREIIRAYRIGSRGDRRFRLEEILQLQSTLEQCGGDERKAVEIIRNN